MLQVPMVEAVRANQIVGSGIALGAIVVLLLVALGVTQHRASAEGPGGILLWTDAALLVVYGFSGLFVWKLNSANSIAASLLGAKIGLIFGAVAIANHLVEVFVRVRPFVVIISPVLLSMALLGTAGAAAWDRTRSLKLAVVGGLCCAVVATLIMLCFATSFNLLFAARVDGQLRDAFAISGMIDRGAFRVRNILESSSEILRRMPLLAICLALAGAVICAWMSRESRRARFLAGRFLGPFVLVLGIASLRHADAIERASRPPFVVLGVLLTGVSLCAAYPIWSAFHDSRAKSRSAKNAW